VALQSITGKQFAARLPAVTEAVDSGVLALRHGRDAFAARVHLANQAQRTLDARYYIWRNDLSGTLLFGSLVRAADRGVRVRLLLDDNNTDGLDIMLAALDAHSNIEVRLFNPFTLRHWRPLNYLTDFSRLNRRLHNKSFTVDNRATIIGGRNIGNEYFDTGDGVSFVDLDVLAIGPIVNDVSSDFERYWNCASSHPIADLLPRIGKQELITVRESAAHLQQEPAARTYNEAIARSSFTRDYDADELPFEWAPAQMISDDPAKGLGRGVESDMVWPRIRDILGTASRELHLASAYFVPGTRGAKFFAASAKRGIRVAILTNSLEATDVPIVHSGYAKWRKQLIKAGAHLFEMKRAFAPTRPAHDKSHGSGGSSSASLHAKTFVIDRSRVFIGSFNFDPRSARLNTEMGFIVDSPALAATIADNFATEVPARSYRVELNDASSLRWIEQIGDNKVVHSSEPGASLWRRFTLSVLSKLPVEWLL
jgi:putative cardiolipin synthase